MDKSNTETMTIRAFKSIANYKTASRCWIPATQLQRSNNMIRNLSSQQRHVNFSHITENNLVADDGIIANVQEDVESNEQEFEPVIFSSNEVSTAGPVNKI